MNGKKLQQFKQCMWRQQIDTGSYLKHELHDDVIGINDVDNKNKHLIWPP